MIFNVNSGAGKIPVNVVPDTSSSFTYDGNTKTPVWRNYDAEQLSISGADSATNAGTHTVYFTPKADYEWWDGTSTPKEVTWSIAKAAGSLSLSATSGTIIGKNSAAKTFTVTRAGDGEISVSSSNTAYATASVSGTTVTVTPKGYGTATITVSVAEGANHLAPESKTYTITVDYLYLYNWGDNCAAITGGWRLTHNAYGAVDFIENNGSGFMVLARSTTCEAIVSTNLPIDMSGFTKLRFNVGTTGNGPFLVGIMPVNNKFDMYAFKQYETETGYHWAEIDISNLSYGYVGFTTSRPDRLEGQIAFVQIYMC